MSYMQLRKLVKQQIQNKLFDEALKTIRSWDVYVQVAYLAEVILALEKEGQFDQALSLVEETRLAAREAASPEYLDGDLAIVGGFLARQGKHELAETVFRDAFHLSRQQQTFGESLHGMKQIADHAELYFENIFELINDEDLEYDYNCRATLPELIRYMLEKKMGRQNREALFRLIGFTRNVISRVKNPVTQAFSWIPVAECVMRFDPAEAMRIYDGVFSVIELESKEYLEEDAMNALVVSLVHVGRLDKALAFTENIRNPWDYFWTRYEIANALAGTRQLSLGEEQIQELRVLTASQPFIERLQALEEQGYDPVKELLASINEMLDTYPQWNRHILTAIEPQKLIKG